MKRKWKIFTISILLIGLITYGTYITIRIFTSQNLYIPTVNTETYFEFEKKYKKQMHVLESEAYQKGVQDYKQGAKKKERGFDYSAEAEEMMKELPYNGTEGYTQVVYDDFYEKGYNDAQQKEKNKK